MEEAVAKLAPEDFTAPPVLLAGPVDYDMYKQFREQLGTAPALSLSSCRPWAVIRRSQG